MLLKPYLPNSSRDLLAICRADGRGKSRPMKFIQLIGGKRWSLALCIDNDRKRTPRA